MTRPYSLFEPGATAPVSVLGNSCEPTPVNKATDPATSKIRAITVPPMSTKGLVSHAVSIHPRHMTTQMAYPLTSFLSQA